MSDVETSPLRSAVFRGGLVAVLGALLGFAVAVADPGPGRLASFLLGLFAGCAIALTALVEHVARRRPLTPRRIAAAAAVAHALVHGGLWLAYFQSLYVLGAVTSGSVEEGFAELSFRLRWIGENRGSFALLFGIIGAPAGPLVAARLRAARLGPQLALALGGALLVGGPCVATLAWFNRWFAPLVPVAVSVAVLTVVLPALAAAADELERRLARRLA